jgi:hypothetical protein
LLSVVLLLLLLLLLLAVVVVVAIVVAIVIVIVIVIPYEVRAGQDRPSSIQARADKVCVRIVRICVFRACTISACEYV